MQIFLAGPANRSARQFLVGALNLQVWGYLFGYFWPRGLCHFPWLRCRVVRRLLVESWPHERLFRQLPGNSSTFSRSIPRAFSMFFGWQITPGVPIDFLMVENWVWSGAAGLVERSRRHVATWPHVVPMISGNCTCVAVALARVSNLRTIALLRVWDGASEPCRGDLDETVDVVLVEYRVVESAALLSHGPGECGCSSGWNLRQVPASQVPSRAGQGHGLPILKFEGRDRSPRSEILALASPPVARCRSETGGAACRTDVRIKKPCMLVSRARVVYDCFERCSAEVPHVADSSVMRSVVAVRCFPICVFSSRVRGSISRMRVYWEQQRADFRLIYSSTSPVCRLERLGRRLSWSRLGRHRAQEPDHRGVMVLVAPLQWRCTSRAASSSSTSWHRCRVFLFL